MRFSERSSWRSTRSRDRASASRGCFSRAPSSATSGRLIPQLIGVFLYVGFNVFNTIIAGTALSTVTGLELQPSILLMAGAALVLTIGGYDWIHFVQRWGTYLFLIVFGIFTVGVLFTGNRPPEQVTGDFAWTRSWS